MGICKAIKFALVCCGLYLAIAPVYRIIDTNVKNIITNNGTQMYKIKEEVWDLEKEWRCMSMFGDISL